MQKDYSIVLFAHGLCENVTNLYFKQIWSIYPATVHTNESKLPIIVLKTLRLSDVLSDH